MHVEGFVPPLVWALPFVGLLLAIAILPLAAPGFWESNLRKLGVAILLGVPVLLLYLHERPEALVHTAADYVSFIVLLAGLFVISGGILIEGDLEATPRTNATFLGVGIFTLAIGALIWLIVSDDPPGIKTEPHRETLRESVAGHRGQQQRTDGFQHEAAHTLSLTPGQAAVRCCRQSCHGGCRTGREC